MESSKDSGDSGADQILVEEKQFTRMLTLNRPRQLNALSFQMISDLLKHFTAYEEDPNVKLLILKIPSSTVQNDSLHNCHRACLKREGKGRAFCAGGDVAGVAHSVTDGHWTNGANFFWNEFRLNYLIATYNKPQVSLLDGIVMGGGAGVSIHGRFRVATEKTVFAMPETGLGLFPDIGSSYFLSRLPGFFGEYVGLTGARLNGAEMLSCGLATHFVPSERLTALEESLTELGSSDPFVVCAVLDKYSEQVPLKENSAFNRLNVIDKCFSEKSVEEIISALEQEAVNNAEWIPAVVQSLKKASPLSLKISLRSIREGRLQSIGQCLIKDYRVCCHILRKEASNDFFEGCRALLVDKDKNPKWEPSKLELINGEMVDRYFSKVNEEGWEDLKLPPRLGPGFKFGSKL